MICITQTEPPPTPPTTITCWVLEKDKRKQCSHLYICVLRFSMNLNHGVVVDKNAYWVLILHYRHASGPRLLVKSRVFLFVFLNQLSRPVFALGFHYFWPAVRALICFSTQKVGLSVKGRYRMRNASWVLSLFTRPRFPGERRSDTSCRLSSDLRWIVGSRLSLQGVWTSPRSPNLRFLTGGMASRCGKYARAKCVTACVIGQ